MQFCCLSARPSDTFVVIKIYFADRNKSENKYISTYAVSKDIIKYDYDYDDNFDNDEDDDA